MHLCSAALKASAHVGDSTEDWRNVVFMLGGMGAIDLIRATTWEMHGTRFNDASGVPRGLVFRRRAAANEKDSFFGFLFEAVCLDGP